MGAPSGTKNEYRNVSGGVQGIVLRSARSGEMEGAAVYPGDTVWMTEEERIATANAPHSDDHNPFINGALVLVTEGAEVKNKRPFDAPREEAQPEEEAPAEETGAAPEASGPPPEGSRPTAEEVATPDAVPQEVEKEAVEQPPSEPIAPTDAPKAQTPPSERGKPSRIQGVSPGASS